MSALLTNIGIVTPPQTSFFTLMNSFFVEKFEVYRPMTTTLNPLFLLSKLLKNIDEITKLLDEYDFHEVYLRLIYSHNYNSLGYIFQSKCLAILHLTKCGYFKDVFCGLEIIPSLQELKLENVLVSEYNLSKCPYIRELSLVNCPWLRDIVIPKVDRLKKLYVKMIDNYNSYRYISIQVLIVRISVQMRSCETEKPLKILDPPVP
ncbi:hypothetical protein H5410_018855 [Solanum commersonii]|uniref:Uncharacterized protein n=1 Tax=Solanum commersonii TaxID=4109 RepID=A0A9J6A4L1_SOLCO|nr:hypothetical protein H5410_018855 [Solanum commersonii]